MRKAALIILAAIVAPAWTAIAELDVQEKATIRKTWTIAAPADQTEVKIDNIDGAIDVVGYNGRDIEIIAEQTIQAESNDKLQRAKQEVRLLLDQKGNSIEAYVEAPWRCQNGINYRGWRYYGYKVSYDFQVKVPAETRLYLRTINRGGIKVLSMSGDFDIENINGGIEMLEAGGSGRAYAFNGKVKVLFTRNPSAGSYFGSLNGDVDLYFRPNLAADFRLKNFNGGIYTDFPVTYLPVSSPKQERHNGMFVYCSNDFFGARVGNGGPEIKVEGFNGNIRLHEREK